MHFTGIHQCCVMHRWPLPHWGYPLLKWLGDPTTVQVHLRSFCVRNFGLLSTTVKLMMGPWNALVPDLNRNHITFWYIRTSSNLRLVFSDGYSTPCTREAQPNSWDKEKLTVFIIPAGDSRQCLVHFCAGSVWNIVPQCQAQNSFGKRVLEKVLDFTEACHLFYGPFKTTYQLCTLALLQLMRSK